MIVSVLVVGLVEVGAGIVCHRSARAPRLLRGKRIATTILGSWLIFSGLLVILGQLIEGSFTLFMNLNAFSAIGALPAILWAQQLDQDATKKQVLVREIAGLLEWRASVLSATEPQLVESQSEADVAAEGPDLSLAEADGAA